MDDHNFPEKWITAFLSHAKVTEICKAGGFSKTKYYQLKHDVDFQRVLRERRDMAVMVAVDALRAHFLRDVEILAEIAEDDSTAPQVRINAISVALSQLQNRTQTVDLIARIEALETKNDENLRVFPEGYALPSRRQGQPPDPGQDHGGLLRHSDAAQADG